MLNRIRIQGFKCFREAEIRFSDFTLLAGKNSTGKLGRIIWKRSNKG